MATEQAHARTTSRRRALGLSAFALLAVLGFCLWLGCQEVPQQLQRLPDGETLRLLGVTHDKKPEMQTGAPLLRFLAPVIPQEHHAGLGLATWSDDTQPLTVWLSFSDKFGLNSPLARFNGVVRAWDENRNCAAYRVGSLLHMDDYPVYPLTLYAFPRRGKALRVVLFGDDGTGRVDRLASFRVANPYFKKYPQWSALPMPARMDTRGLPLALERLETGLPERQTPDALRGSELLESGVPVWTEAVLSLREAGHPTDDWKIQAVHFEDATGNEISPEFKLQPMSAGKVRMRFPRHLWGEPAWQVRIEVERVRNLSPTQFLRYRVRIPESGEGSSVTYLSRRKSPLRIISIFGPKLSEEKSALSAMIDINEAGLIAEMRGESNEATVDLVSIGIGGRRREVFIEGVRFDDANLWYSLGTARPGTAVLTFAVRDRRKFTFRVRPTIH